MNSSRNLKIVLSGGGLVGSLLAILLGKKGYSVEVYEKREDIRASHSSAGRSINLALANRGIAPLIRAGVMEEVEKIILPMRGRIIHDVAGGVNFQAYGQKPEEVIYSVSRSDLNRLLMTAAEATGNVTYIFEAEVTEVNLEGRTFHYKSPNGKAQQVEYDLLIGTDGAGSEVRRAVLSQKGSELNSELLDHSYKELLIKSGPDRSFLLDPKALHIWPRGEYMMIALPNPDGSFTATMFLPRTGPVSFEALNNEARVDEFFTEVFPDMKNLVPDLVTSFLKNPLGGLGTVKCYPWSYEGSALLMGDAAHAIVPFHGQGMNCGFEDCAAFDELLEKEPVQTESDLKALLLKFQNLRKPNSDAIADLALDNYIEMRSKVIDPRFLIKKKMEFELENLFPEVFIPRYSRVMFQHTPYKDAKYFGEVQEEILEQLYDDYVKDQKIPVQKAQQLVQAKLQN